jgi:sec-independent protein translocase protein TatB
MFGIDGWELLIIGVIAVIVLGPERLPKAARFAGLWVRRARAQWYSVKSELERELAAEELKRSLQDTRRAVADIDAEIGQSIRSARDEARREFDAMRGDIEIGAGDGPTTPSDDAADAPMRIAQAPAEHASVEHASVEYALVEPVGIDYNTLESAPDSRTPAPQPTAATSPSRHETPDDRG